MNVIPLVVLASVALLITVSLIPVIIHLAYRFGAVSETGGRHIGEKPIARLGGLAVVVSVVVVSAFSIAWDVITPNLLDIYGRKMVGLFIGGSMVALVGFVDDFRQLGATHKLGVQIAAASVSWFFGIRIEDVDLPVLKPIYFGIFSYPVTIIWIVGFVNAINLIDGLDGLAGGILLISTAANLVIGVEENNYLEVLLMTSALGAILGFLLFNWHPAKIYLGDGGAYFLGFLLASYSLLGPFHKVSTGVSVLPPIIAAGLPLFDSVLAVLRRRLSGRRIFSPDRGHIHHILLDAGISHRGVVIGLYIISLCLAEVAILVAVERSHKVVVLLLGSSLTSVGFWVFNYRSRLLRSWKKGNRSA